MTASTVPKPPVDGALDLAGARLATVTWDGPGPALVLLPGAGGNALMFADLVDRLPDRQALAIDPPGMGRSDDPTTYDLVATADALALAWRGKSDQPAIWTGHSWGGKVAAIVAARHPDIAAATILIDPSPANSLNLDDTMISDFATSIWDGAGGPWPALDAAIESLVELPRYHKATPGLRAGLHRNVVETPDGLWTSRCSLRFLVDLSHATLNVDNADIAKLAAPTLYLVASESTWWQAISNDVALPGHVQRVELPGSHFLYLDNPAGVADSITAFIASL